VPPTLTCPSDVNVSNDPGVCGAIVIYDDPIAFDSCPVGLGTPYIDAGLPSGSLFSIGTTVVTWMVADAEGATATCSFSVTVNDTEDPSFSGVPADFAACNPVSWIPPVGLDNCPNVSVVSSHTPPFTFPSGTTTVTYTATDASNNQTSVSFDVTVLEPSFAADEVVSDRDYNNICRGENITLTVVGGSLGENANWVWYAGGCGTGTPVGTGTSITVSPLNTTTYYVRAEGLCNTTSCVLIQVVVSIAPPVGPVTYNVVPVFGAPGVTDLLSVNPVSGATYYQWSTNNGQINGVLFNNALSPVQTTIPSVNVSFVLPQQNYQIRVIAGNACGRTNTANTHIRGTVGAPDNLTGPTEVCPSTSHQYTVSAIPAQSGGSPVSYNWQLIPSNAGTISGTGLTRTVTFAPGFTSAQLCVNGISSFGLAGPALCITITTAAPAPAAISGSNLVCADGITPVTYTASAVGSAISYSWTVPAGASISGAANGQSIDVIFGPAFTGGQVCVAAVTASCGTSSFTCMTVSNNVVGDPGVIQGPSSGVCGESNVSYSLTIGGAMTYSWTLPAGASFVGMPPYTSSAINVAFDGSGAFTSGIISVEAMYACGSVTRDISVSGAPPVPTVDPATLCANSFEVYTASSTGATDYFWSVTGDAYHMAIFNELSVQWGATGNSFSVYATNACGTSPTFTLNQNCRMGDPGAMGQIINIYPNPTSGKVNLEFTSESASAYKVTVTDLSGRSVLVSEIQAAAGINRQVIDLSFANKGLYMLYLNDNSGNSSVTKIAVE
jgi:hypothetical protein